MGKTPEKKDQDGERIPFDDALRQILKAPPAHKTSSAKKRASKGKKNRG
jgi:hypothetical protein